MSDPRIRRALDAIRVDPDDAEPTPVSETAIPDSLCGVGGCAYMKHHTERKHSWQM